MNSCSDITHSLGAYVVGAIDAQERAEVDAHLAACPSCRDELASLAALPGLMSRLSLGEVLDGPPAMEGGMLERLLAAAARERRAARQRRWLSVAAAVVIAAGASTAGVAAYNSATGPHWHTVNATAGAVHVKVDLAGSASGTQLRLHLSGVPADERCSLVAVSDTGVREVAGWWEATYSGTAVVRGTTSIDYHHLAKLVIQTNDGRELVSTPI